MTLMPMNEARLTGAELLVTESLRDDGLVSAWLRRYSSAATRDAYGRALRRLQAHLGGWPLVQVREEHLLAFAAELAVPACALAANSQATVLNAVRSFYAWLFRHHGLTMAREGLLNPALEIRVPRGRDRVAERVLFEEAWHAVRAEMRIEPPVVQAALLLGLASGLRVSEVAGLRWCDVSFAPVPQGKGTAGGSAARLTVIAKGGDPHSVELKPEHWALIASLLPEKLGESEPLLGYNLDHATGELLPYSRHALTRRCNRVTLRALGRRVPFHGLRHSHATLALRGGARESQVVAQLGHKSRAMLDRYVHLQGGDSSGYFIEL